ncbi:hypothetical protein FRC08_000754 [Ceratobasidium sp. 394]|nr:hypothetical protein FRC08_000754 [Ceratobasidium sp. 394]
MKGPPSQTLAPLAYNSSTSSYKFRLDSSALQLIDLGSFKYVALEQRCLELQASANTTIISSNYGFSALAADGGREYSLSVSRCASGSSHVDSYRVGLCTTPGSAACSWAALRQLRTYLTGKPGVTNGTAVDLDMDYDNWVWN